MRWFRLPDWFREATQDELDELAEQRRRADEHTGRVARLHATVMEQRRRNGFAEAIEETMRGRPWRDRPA